MKKKIKEAKDIYKDEDDFSINDVRKGLLELIKEGKIACIISINNEGIIEDSYINGHQVIVKCPHCGKIVNIGKFNPRPEEEK